MKKNLSFLSKVGVAAASVALVAGLAWADGDPQPAKTKILTVPTSIQPGTEANPTIVVFAGIDDGGNKYVLSNTDGTGATQWSTPTAAAPEFKVVPGENGKVIFEAGTGANLVRVKSGDIVKAVQNQDLEEVQWKIDGSKIQSVSSSGYLYFDSESKKFQTTLNESVPLVAFVKEEVENATIDVTNQITDGENKNISTVNTVTYLKYDGNLNNNPEINVKTAATGANLCVAYKINDGLWTTNYSKDIKISLAKYNGLVTVKTATASYVGEQIIDMTDETEATYSVVNMTPVIRETADAEFGKLEGETLQRPFAGCAGLLLNEVASVGHAAHTADLDYSDTKVYDSEDALISSSIATSDNGVCLNDFQNTQTQYTDVPTTIKVVVKHTTSGFTAAKDFNVTIKSHLTEAQVYKTTGEGAHGGFDYSITYENGANAPLPTKSLTIKWANDAQTTDPANGYSVKYLDGNNKPAIVLNYGGADHAVAANDITITSNTAWTLPVPADYVANQPITLKVPAGAFEFTSGSNAYSNVYKSKALEVQLNQPYTDAIFNVNQEYIYVEKEANRQTPYEYTDFVITGPNGEATSFVQGKDVSCVEVVSATDEEVELTGADVAYENGKFKVSLPSTIELKNYMVKFPAYSLVHGTAGNGQINKQNVNIYINVQEKVNFTYALCNADGKYTSVSTDDYTFCENDDVYVMVTATTESNASALAALVGDIYVGDVKKENLTMSSNKILVGSVEELAGKTITLKAGAIKSKNSSNIADKSMKVIKAPHVDFKTQLYAFANSGATTANFKVIDTENSAIAANYTANNVEVPGTEITANINVANGIGTITVPQGTDIKDIDGKTITIPADKMTSSCGCKNKAVSVTIAVDKYITFGIAYASQMKEIGTDVTSIEFDVETLPFTTDVNVIEGAKAKLEGDGSQMDVTLTKKSGSGNTFIATFASSLKAVNYSLVIPANTLTAQFNNNEAALNLSVNVKNAVAFNRETASVEIDKATTSFDVVLKATDIKVNPTQEVTGAMTAVTTNWTLANASDNAVTVTRNGITGKFTVTLATALTEDDELIIPAGALKANFSANNEIRIPLNVHKTVAFAVENKTINQTTTEFEVKVAGETTVVVNDGATVNIYSTYNPQDPSQNVLATTPTIVVNNDGENEAAAGCVAIKLSAALPVATYIIVFEAGGLTADVTTNATFSGTLKVQKEMVFNDLGNNAETTQQNSLVEGTYAKVTYKRNFGKTTKQAFVVPFDVPASEFEGVKIYRVNTIRQNGDAEAEVHITQLANDDNIYAYMPYVIEAEQTGNYSIDLEPESGIKVYAATQADRPGSVTTSTTKYDFVFTSQPDGLTAENVAGKFVMNGGLLTLVNSASNNLAPWRWTMTTNNKNVSYGKIVVDDEFSTGINSVDMNDIEDGQIYNVAGQRQSNLHNGINIVNGKKVVIRK